VRNQKNIEFASVHDSFWTHPCDVDILNEVLRETFVELHHEVI
jgi:DNA-directed RNA polymerase